jgi:high-affinity nickel permease
MRHQLRNISFSKAKVDNFVNVFEYYGHFMSIHSRHYHLIIPNLTNTVVFICGLDIFSKVDRFFYKTNLFAIVNKNHKMIRIIGRLFSLQRKV